MPTTEELAAVAQKALQKERAREILLANKEVPFIRRLLNPNAYPVMKMGEHDATAQLSTHAYGPEETYKGVPLGGKEWVVPNIIYGDSGQLVMRGPEDRMWDRDQIARGNAISFDDPELAHEFSAGSWKRHFGGMIPEKAAQAPQVPQRKLAGPLEDALARAMANESLALGPGSYPDLP